MMRDLNPQANYILIMGVSGCGKSTIAAKLSFALHLPLIEADDYHPAENKTKMSNGVPLTDDDRWPWLNAISNEISKEKSGCIISCSALKESYRDILFNEVDPNTNIYKILLQADYNTLASRMKERNHFMPVSLLDSQLATLQMSDDLIVIDATTAIDSIIDNIKNHLQNSKYS